MFLIFFVGFFLLLISINTNAIRKRRINSVVADSFRSSRMSRKIIESIKPSSVSSIQQSKASLLTAETAAKLKKSPTRVKNSFDFYEELIANPNKYIDKYIEKHMDYFNGSKLIPLLISALSTDGDILELGMDKFSTRLLHKISVDFNRTVISVDNNLERIKLLNQYNTTELHRLIFLPTRDDMHKFGIRNLWGLVLVDHVHADERYKDVLNFANRAKIVLAHEAEKKNEYFYKYEENKVRGNYKYVCKLSVYINPGKTSYISTLIMSNYIDLEHFGFIFDKVKTDYGHVSCDTSY